ncbi:LuxR family transcriptional regulator [uncultured Jannaschia sp.]|uniref:helix-turn-helix transcriptional regulator n=1 Tax=Jannaschia halovivens TaxID=3388667 RepID=UPI002611A2DC|nr:LuxR family transcriptional regulator [uncultured Jannaschia sp.]
MLIDDARRIEALDTPRAVWDATVETLATEGVGTVLYLISDKERRDVRVMTTAPEIHADDQPEKDPFLDHCCDSYAITRTGAAFIDEHEYLCATDRAFILRAQDHGFVSGLGIPTRLQGSLHYGGFNLGTPLDRAAFEEEIAPRQEEFRLFCLLVHRRFEELGILTAPCGVLPAPLPPRARMVAPETERLAALSPREREVIWLQSQGLPRKEVARLCGISPNTVAEYASKAYRKLGVRNRTEAARMVFEA